MNTAHQLIAASKRLVSALENLNFSAPVTHVYNPLSYANESHELYLNKFATNPKQAIFLGMNPGPWGMAQTGVPFGEIPAVRDWMGICSPVAKPTNEHPKRPIDGFHCTRSEVSGRRLWGLFADQFGQAEDFFNDHFVLNFCPLVWMSETGRNITPDKLPKSELLPVEEACMRHLVEVLNILHPPTLVGVGKFAFDKLKLATPKLNYRPQQVGSIIHPSPASPIANRDWPQRPLKELRALKVIC